MSHQLLDEMRPCVKDAFENGVHDKDTLKSMRHAIICEMNQLGIDKGEIKMHLLEWNDRNYQPFTQNDAKRQLLGYVDWFFGIDKKTGMQRICKLSCRGLQAYCIHPNGGCRFTRKSNNTLPYLKGDACGWLVRNYPKSGIGYSLGLLLSVIIDLWNDKGRPEQLYAGIRTIQTALIHRHNTQLDLMTITRRLHDLAGAGFIAIAHDGVRGEFGYKNSNAYELLPWVPPMEKKCVLHPSHDNALEKAEETHNSGVNALSRINA